jgi:hypothetical protein
MSSIKTLMLLLLIALSLNAAACDTTARSQSKSGAQVYGVQGAIDRSSNSGIPWDAYGGP